MMVEAPAHDAGRTCFEFTATDWVLSERQP